jgi:hypothetical protein
MWSSQIKSQVRKKAREQTRMKEERRIRIGWKERLLYRIKRADIFDKAHLSTHLIQSLLSELMI